jgi:hypothetical protein
MKALIFTCVVFAAVVSGASSNSQRRKSSAPTAQKMPTLEGKLATLKKCGIGLTRPYTVKDLLESYDRQTLEKPGYDMLLVGLGSSEEEPYRKLAVNVWYFDTETIYESGDYKQIAERLVEMTQGSLALHDIRDHFDAEKPEASLSFTFKGRPMKINLTLNDDWVDTMIFARFVELLKESDPSKIYLYYDLGGGQDCVLSCVKKREFECLKGEGIKFIPLTGPANFAEADPGSKAKP